MGAKAQMVDPHVDPAPARSRLHGQNGAEHLVTAPFRRAAPESMFHYDWPLTKQGDVDRVGDPSNVVDGIVGPETWATLLFVASEV